MKSLFESAIPHISLDKRARKGMPWTGIVNHHTGLSKEIPSDESKWKSWTKAMANWLSLKDDTYASAHFLIGRSGEIYLLVDPRTHVAFHAGTSSFWDSHSRRWVSGCNEYMIGIEWAGDGNRVEYSEAQYESAAFIHRELMREFPSIQPHGITGHEVVSPGRKVDPGEKFDWKHLFSLIFKNDK